MVRIGVGLSVILTAWELGRAAWLARRTPDESEAEDARIHYIARVWRQVPLRTAFDLLMLSSIVTFLAFFAFCVGNKHFVYISNICFPLLMLSAGGWWFGMEALLRVLPESIPRARGVVATCLFVGLGACLFPVRGSLSSGLNHSPNSSYHGTREALRRFVKPDLRLVLGASAYPWLYDSRYTGARALEVQCFTGPPGSGGYELHIPKPALKEALRQACDAIVIPDIYFMYQYKILEAEVLGANFVLIGAVVPGNELTVYRIYYRRDVATELRRDLRLEPYHVTRDSSGAVAVTFGPNEIQRDRASERAWSALSDEEKKRAIASRLSPFLENFDQQDLNPSRAAYSQAKAAIALQFLEQRLRYFEFIRWQSKGDEPRRSAWDIMPDALAYSLSRQ